MNTDEMRRQRIEAEQALEKASEALTALWDALDAERRRAERLERDRIWYRQEASRMRWALIQIREYLPESSPYARSIYKWVDEALASRDEAPEPTSRKRLDPPDASMFSPVQERNRGSLHISEYPDTGSEAQEYHRSQFYGGEREQMLREEGYKPAQEFSRSRYAQDVAAQQMQEAQESQPATKEPAMTAFPNNPDLHREIAAALNRHGVDNDTATPDYILAEYAIVSIQNFANARADIAERQESQPERGERVPEALRKYAYALHEQAKVAAKKGDYVKAGQKELCAQAFDGAIQRAEREERVPDRIKMLVDAFREQAFDDPPTLYVEGFSDAIRIAARELERTIREIEGGEDA